MEPVRTVLDAGLSIVRTRAATTPKEAGTSGRSWMFIRERMSNLGLRAAEIVSMTTSVAEPEVEVVSAKLLVSSREIEVAEGWVEKHGGTVESLPSSFRRETAAATLIVRLPVTELEHLESEPWVRRVEAPNQLTALLDHARGEATGLDSALATSWASGLTGKGVLIGIIDTGVDWRHPDFVQPDGTSKIELFVHASHKPRGDGYAEFGRDAISASLEPGWSGESPPLGDPHGHGTHCASIAAGLGTASNGQYRGVAPDSPLFVMRSDGLYDDHLIWGIRRAFELARDRPAVINLSLGGHFGAHDGTSALENEIARLSGAGRIVVCAAGNEGTDAIHSIGDLRDGPVEFPFVVADDYQILDVWIARPDDVDVFVLAPDGTRIEPPATELGVNGLQVSAYFLLDPISRDQNFRVEIIGGAHSTNIWKVVVQPNHVVHGIVHAWGTINNPLVPAQLMIRPTQDYTAAMPATEERCIAVGSFVTRTAGSAPPGGLSAFSSRGPTRVGIQKPDIAAPGEQIMAAAARIADSGSEDSYIQKSGTSMAAPFVAGVIALLLQCQPRLGPEEIQQYFRATANRDRFTGAVWNPGWGWGKIDVQSLFRYLEESGVPPAPA
jgi:subtilisin family serine protease